MKSQNTQESDDIFVQERRNIPSGSMFEFWAKQAESLRTERALETDADISLVGIEAHEQRRLISSILGYLPDNDDIAYFQSRCLGNWSLYSGGDRSPPQQVGPSEQELARLPHHLRRKRPYERLSLAQMYFWSVDAHGGSSVTLPSCTASDACSLPTAFDLALSEAQAAECVVIDLDIRKSILDHATTCPQQCGTPSCNGSQTFVENDVLAQYLAERESPPRNSLVKDFRESMAVERSAYQHHAILSAYSNSHLPRPHKLISSSVRVSPADRSWKGQTRSYIDKQDVELYDALICQWFTACNEVVLRRAVVEKMLLDVPFRQNQPFPSSKISPRIDSLRNDPCLTTPSEVTKHGPNTLLTGPPRTVPPEKPLPPLPLTDISAASKPEIVEGSERLSMHSLTLTVTQPRLAHVELTETAAVKAAPCSESTRSSSPATSLATHNVTSSFSSSATTAPTSCTAEGQQHELAGSIRSNDGSTSRASPQLPELALLSVSSASPQSKRLPKGKSLKRRSQSSIASIAFTVASGSDMPSLPPLSDIESDDDDCGDSMSDTSTIPGVTEMDLEIARMRRRLGRDIEY